MKPIYSSGANIYLGMMEPRLLMRVKSLDKAEMLNNTNTIFYSYWRNSLTIETRVNYLAALDMLGWTNTGSGSYGILSRR